MNKKLLATTGVFLVAVLLVFSTGTAGQTELDLKSCSPGISKVNTGGIAKTGRDLLWDNGNPDGTNGLSWKVTLGQLKEIVPDDEVRQLIIRENAVKAFKL